MWPIIFLFEAVTIQVAPREYIWRSERQTRSPVEIRRRMKTRGKESVQEAKIRFKLTFLNISYIAPAEFWNKGKQIYRSSNLESGSKERAELSLNVKLFFFAFTAILKVGVRRGVAKVFLAYKLKLAMQTLKRRKIKLFFKGVWQVVLNGFWR